MKPEERRRAIERRLRGAAKPIAASRLAEEFEVSRQIIVQDIALMRASGLAISGMARGYLLETRGKCRRIFKLCHSDEDTERELRLIIDAGGIVQDVFVFHKVYGKVQAELGLSSARDIAHFLEDVASGKSGFLKNVTSGYHYHTVTARSERILDTIEALLRDGGFIAPLREFEPADLMALPKK